MTASGLKSMTGFGAGLARTETARVRVEVRAVNHRGLKIVVRSRPSIGPVEKDLREMLSAVVVRGHIDVAVDFRRLAGGTASPLRTELARETVSSLRTIALDLELSGELTVSDLLNIPGLLDGEDDSGPGPEDLPVFKEALTQALGQLEGMRGAEGAALAQVLQGHVDAVSAFGELAAQRAAVVPQRTRERLQQRLAEFGQLVSDAATAQALEREVVLFADRADIREELDRLTSHTEQFKAALTSGGVVGKRLEFLAQEMLREVNTCASKGNDTPIAAAAVEAKLAIERIKEQVANVE